MTDNAARPYEVLQFSGKASSREREECGGGDRSPQADAG